MIGGSADLAGSTCTWPSEIKAVSAQEPRGRFIHYGVREFGMATLMNGLAAHGGFLPYGGTFVVFFGLHEKRDSIVGVDGGSGDLRLDS